MLQCPIVDAPDMAPTRAIGRKISFVPAQDMVEFVSRAPERSRLYARGKEDEKPSAQSAVSLHWAIDKSVRWRCYRDSVWYGLDPMETWRELAPWMKSIGASWKPTPGGCAASILDAWTRLPNGRRDPRWDSYPEKIREFCREGIHGGAMRVRRTYAYNSVLVDMREAYAEASKFIPVGRPQWWPRLTEDQLTGRMRRWYGIVDARVIPITDRAVLPMATPEGLVHWPLHKFFYRGPIRELISALDMGAVVLDGHACGWLMNQCTDSIYLYTQQMKEALNTGLYKMIYRAMWPRWDSGSGWRGDFRPPQDGDLTDRYDPDLQWVYQPRDYTGRSDQLMRPEIAAHIPGMVRAEVMREWHALPREDVHAVLVDALIMSSGAWSDAEKAMNLLADSWRVKGRGTYFGAYPGQYVLGGRFRLSGIHRDQMSLGKLRRQVGRLWRELGRPTSDSRPVCFETKSGQYRTNWISFEIPENRAVKVAGRW